MKKLLIIFLTVFSINSNATLTAAQKQFIDKIESLENGGFENGLAGWTASGGSFTKLSGSSALDGAASARFNASASGQSVCSKSYTVPKGIQGLPSLGYFKYITTESTNKYKVTVIDGSSNVISTNTLDASSSANFAYAPFNAPTSGTYKLCIESTGDAADIDLDFGHLGSDTRLADISQSVMAGESYFAGTSGCAINRTSTTIGAFGGLSACPAPTIVHQQIGNWQTTDADNFKQTINNLPAGIYVAEFSVVAYMNTGSGAVLAIHDGTTTCQADGIVQGISAVNQKVSCVFVYTTSGNRTFEMYGASNTGSLTLQNTSTAPTASSTKFKLYYYPSATETGVRVDQLGWKVDANISGANPSLSTGSITTDTGIENASLTLTNNSGNGNISAQIPCSGTNSSTGTSCSAGNESVGVVFNVPTAGDVYACVSFSNVISVTNGQLSNIFSINETLNNSQTIIQSGKTRLSSQNLDTATNANNTFPYRICSNFTFASSGTRTLRLMYQTASVGGGVTSNLILGQSINPFLDIHWEVYPLNYLSGAMPIFKGMVTSNAENRERIERATVTSNCTSSPCTINGQSGSWLSSISRNATGNYTANINSGIFSELPSCVCTAAGVTDERVMCVLSTSSTSNSTAYHFKTWTFSGNAIDSKFNIICMGK